MTRPPKSKAIERLRKVLNEISALKDLSTDAPEFKKWHRNTRIAIGYAFGEEGRHVSEFCVISFFPTMGNPPILESEVLRRRAEHEYERPRIFVKSLEATTSLLESMIEEIEEDREDDDQALVISNSQRDELKDRTKIFVVHGRDDGARQAVARFIEKLGLEPVILDEQADKGRTIIEKFEQEAEEVRFAVVLLTPDDEGRLRSEEAELKPRARQNVIFELGYFRRTLGPNRVCALKKGEVETPSDYEGVIYIPLDDAGGWKMGLIRELKAAGFDVDANRVL